jgi:hypothetical protein
LKKTYFLGRTYILDESFQDASAVPQEPFDHALLHKMHCASGAHTSPMLVNPKVKQESQYFRLFTLPTSGTCNSDTAQHCAQRWRCVWYIAFGAFEALGTIRLKSEFCLLFHFQLQLCSIASNLPPLNHRFVVENTFSTEWLQMT